MRNSSLDTALLLEEGWLECGECNESFKKDEMHTSEDDGLICEECWSDNYRECKHCNGWYHNDEMQTTDDDYTLCQGCADDHTFSCDDCSEVFYTERADSYSVGGGEWTVCGGCIDNYTECGSCGDRYHQDNMSYCESCGEDYCDNCGHECPSNSALRDPSIVPCHGKKKGEYLKIDRLIGVEIESEEGNAETLSEKLPDECGIEEDGSLDDGGVEVVTPPASLDEAERIITESCNALKEADFVINRTCGLHVHVDARDFKSDTKKLSHLLRTVYAVEDVIFSMLPPSRWNSNWCERLSKKYGFDDFKKTMTLADFEKKWYLNATEEEIEKSKGSKHDCKGTRYHGLNLHSTMYRGTVEFRYHSGSMEPSKILSWAGLLLALVDYSIKRYKDQDINELYSMPVTEMKLRRMFALLKIPDQTQKYIQERIAKFNPKFMSLDSRPDTDE